MSGSDGQSHVPGWDGTARTWRKYHREVAWYVRSTPVHKRRYCAHRLVQRLTGPARLLAMSWPSVSFDHANGTKEYLRRLAASPLVRQSLPNAAAICQQYFAFRRHAGESMQSFLVRESLGYAEFSEAIIRLYEEKRGVLQQDLDFDLPDEEDDAAAADVTWWDEYGWDEGEGDSRPHGPDSGQGHDSPNVRLPITSAAESGSPGGRYSRVAQSSHGSPSKKSAGIQYDHDDLSLTDSFVLGVLRGFRLLQGAGLTAEDMRDIISTTKGSLEFETVTAALQTLWDEQLLGRRSNGSSSRAMESFVVEEHEEEADTSWWDDAYAAEADHHDDDWWEDEQWDYAALDEPETVPEDDEAVKEAQKAEKIAEGLAMEAQRTWTEAQRATQALKKDRGFGHVIGAGKGATTTCWNCGGRHYARDCPDRRHPGMTKGRPKGWKGNYMTEYDTALLKGKGKSKKGKNHHWMEAQAFQKGRGKGKKSAAPRPSVNAYANEMFGLEIASSSMEANSLSSMSRMAPQQGLIDCGATASAAPQIAVENLIASVLAKDSQATVDIHKNARPYFRFGNGGWGRALFQVSIGTNVSGTMRTFRLFALPNPPGLHDPSFDKNSLVPILVGMDHLGGDPSAMLIDFRTGLAMDSFALSPQEYQLPRNKKGHYLLDIVDYLTLGHTRHEGHAHVSVSESSWHAVHTLEFRTVEYYDISTVDVHVSSQALHESRALLRQLHQRALVHCPLHAEALSASMPLGMRADSNSTTASSARDHLHGSQPCSSSEPGGERRDPVGHQVGHGGEACAAALRREPQDHDGPKGSKGRSRPMAVLRTAHPGQAAGEPSRSVDPLWRVRFAPSVCSPQGQSRPDHSESQSTSLQEDAAGALQGHGGSPTHCSSMSGHAEEGGCRRSSGWHGAAGEATCEEAFNDATLLRREQEERGEDGSIQQRIHGVMGSGSEHESDSCTGLAGHGGEHDDRRTEASHEGDSGTQAPESGHHRGRRGQSQCSGPSIHLRSSSTRSSCRKSATARRGGPVGPTTSSPTGCSSRSSGSMSCTTKPLPTAVGKKLLLMATALVSSMASMTMDLCLGQQDGIWEVACAPHSWLSEACAQQGLRPRRINLEQGYDLYKKDTWEKMKSLRALTKPKRIWFSLPCTKFCRWTYLNYASRPEELRQARKKERRMLWSMYDFIEDTLQNDPEVLIYFEWTHPCQGWQEPPMTALEKLMQKLELPWLPCRVDGCAYGMKDKNNENFLHKKWMIRTNDEAFHATYKCKVCHGGHPHALIQGQETARSAYYPWRLVQSWARFWRSQVTSDRNLRLLFLHQDTPAALEEEEIYHLASAAQLHHKEEEHHLLPAQAPEPEQETSEAAPTEDEKRKWAARVAHFHKAAGHPTNRNLARLIKNAGMPSWKSEMALQHQCPACQALQPGGTSSSQIPPASTRSDWKAWQAVGMDVAEWQVPGSKNKVKFLLMMDLATKLRTVQPLLEYPNMEMKAERADHIIQAFTERWLSMFPKPEMVILDNGKSFTSEKLNEFFREINVAVYYPPEKEPWAHGIIEAGVQDVKRTATLIHMEMLDQPPGHSLVLATSALNSTEYTAGFSSQQWAFGQHYSLSDEDHRTFMQMSPTTDFARLVQARQLAEEIAVKSRAKRVLGKLSNTLVRQPLRTYSPMELVKVWRQFQPSDQHKGSRGGFKKSGRPHWIGPGRVVFQEVLPHQEEGDHRRHILWILIGSRIYRCSVHSVRPVTEVERFQHEMTSQEDPTRWHSLSDILPRREFTDLVDEVPGEHDIETPALPWQPDSSTYAPIRRADGKQTLKPSDWHIRHRSSPLGLGPPDPKVQHFVPSTSSAPSTAPPMPPMDPAAAEDNVNDYTPSVAPESPTGQHLDDTSAPHPDEPESKRARSEYDLKWIEKLEEDLDENGTEMLYDCVLELEEDMDILTISFDIEPETNTKKKELLRHPLLYLVKKMNNSEVNIQRLSNLEKVLFNRAKSKEVNSFLKNTAVRRCLDDDEIREAYGANRILKARWVLTWKPVPPDEREEALKDSKENPETVVNSQGTKKAKARIVLLGFQHPNLMEKSFKTAAPVQSGLGRSLLYVLATYKQWEIQGLDLATAFLQTQPTEADQRLWTTGVTELKEAMGLPPDALLRILRNIYGSTTAPRGLWLDLHRTLLKLGAVAAVGERCLWLWFSKTEVDPVTNTPMLLGAMGGHVDDFHRIGNSQSPEWQEICRGIDSAYSWGTIKSRTYRHAGTDITTVKQADGTFRIEVDQDAYIEGIPDLSIAPERLREDLPLTEKEVGACRTALGSLQWLAIQTQPQLCARCNLLLTEVLVDGRTSHAREIQSMIGEIRANPQRLRYFRPPGVHHWSDMIVITMGDQAHANRPKGDSTGGMVTLLAGPESLHGEVTPMMLLGWRSWKLKRKAIASNDAEVQAVLESEDYNFRTRLLWTEINGAGQSRDLRLRKDLVEASENQAVLVKGVICTDSRGGYDAVEMNESPLLGLTNMRAALQAFQLRENLRRCGSELRWLASDYDLNDSMTKKKAECRDGLLKLMSTWHWTIAYDPQFVAAKKNKKLGLTAIDRIDKALESHATLCSSTSPTALAADLSESTRSGDGWNHHLTLFTTGATGSCLYRFDRSTI